MYELDRSTWPKRYARTFDDYLQRWEALLASLSGQVIAFGDDDRVQAIAERYATYIQKPLQSWPSWSSLESARACVARKYRNDVPERFSAEYVCLQLCKFDAMQYAIERFDAKEWVWIDGGLRETMIPKTWDVKWPRRKVYVALQKPQRPMGGCFGGDAESVLWLCEEMRNLREALAVKGECGNDQELLEVVYSKHPHRFEGRKSYNISKWRTYETQWGYLCVALGIMSEPKDEMFVGVYVMVFLACLKLLLAVLGG